MIDEGYLVIYHYSDEDNLETALQLIDDPAERARLIEKAYDHLTASGPRRPRGENS
jgi:hypothetical protein